MKLLPVIKSEIRKSAPSLIIFGVVLALLSLAFFLLNVLSDTADGVFTFDAVLIIYMFVFAVSSYRENLEFGFANSISRRTSFLAFFILLACVALVFSVVNTIYYSVFGIETSLLIIYCFGTESVILKLLILTSVLFMIILSVSCFGLLTASAFYRASSVVRALIAAGIPIFMFVAFPIAFYYLPIKAAAALENAFLFIIGFSGNAFNPINFIVSLAVISAILGGAAYLINRKASIRTK